MTLYTGNLFSALAAYRTSWPSRGFGMLVIDEQGEDRAPGHLRNAMLQAISFAAQANFTIVQVEINPPMDPNKGPRTREDFRAHMPKAVRFLKKGYNAFGVVDASGVGKEIASGLTPSAYADISLLDGILRNAGVGELLVIGQKGSMCVRRTVVGGQEGSLQMGTDGIMRLSGPDMKGALDYGYQVWTSPKLLEWSDDAELRTKEQKWLEANGIKAYSDL
jgi:nicotinamidase-related amidase